MPRQTREEIAQESIEKTNEFLREIGGSRTRVEDPVEYRNDQNPKIGMPSWPEKMPAREGERILKQVADDEEAMYSMPFKFTCRPLDGSWAFTQVLKKQYGLTAIGKATQGFFGGVLPTLVDLDVSMNETVKVPMGEVFFPALGATFDLGGFYDQKFGPTFMIEVTAKKLYEDQINGLMTLVKDFVQLNTVYKNKAMLGTIEPEFFDPYRGVNRRKIVFRTEVQEALDDELIGLIKNADLLREPYTHTYTDEQLNGLSYSDLLTVVETSDGYDPEKGFPTAGVVPAELDSTEKVIDWLKNTGRAITFTIPGEDLGNKVLLHGKPGTGKTVAMKIVAQICMEYNATFIQLPFDEDLTMALRFVDSLPGLKVLAIEDIEKMVKESAAKMDELLEQFDGMQTKGREVILLLTSNRPQELPPQLTRAGRINRMIEVSDLDAPAVEGLINVQIPQWQRDDIDYEALQEAYRDYAPSWIVQALQGVTRRSVIRTGKRGEPLATADFVRTANALRDAHDLHQSTPDRKPKPQLEVALADVVGRAMREHYVEDAGDILVRD